MTRNSNQTIADTDRRCWTYSQVSLWQLVNMASRHSFTFVFTYTHTSKSGSALRQKVDLRRKQWRYSMQFNNTNVPVNVFHMLQFHNISYSNTPVALLTVDFPRARGISSYWVISWYQTKPIPPKTEGTRINTVSCDSCVLSSDYWGQMTVQTCYSDSQISAWWCD